MNILDSLGSGPSPTPEETQCSRKGCRESARWKVLWNNPKIHEPERRKVWLACDEHRDWLRDFLQLRGFWKDTVPMDPHGDPGPPDPENTSEGNE